MLALVFPVLMGLGIIVVGAIIIRHPQIATRFNQRNMNRLFGQWSWTTYWMTYDHEKIDRINRWFGLAVVLFGALYVGIGLLFLIAEATNPGTIRS